MSLNAQFNTCDDADSETKHLLEYFAEEDALARKQTEEEEQELESILQQIERSFEDGNGEAEEGYGEDGSPGGENEEEVEEEDWREFNTLGEEAAFERDIQEAVRRSVRDDALRKDPKGVLPSKAELLEYRRHIRNYHSRTSSRKTGSKK